MSALEKMMQRFSDLKDQVEEVRPPAPQLAKPQWLQGKLTAISALLAGAAVLAKLFGYHLPAPEITSLLHWLSDNWETLAQGLGLIGISYGQLRRNWRPTNATPVLLACLACLSLTSCMAAGGSGDKWGMIAIGTDADSLHASRDGVEITKLNQSKGLGLAQKMARNAAIASAAPGVVSGFGNAAKGVADALK